jgi:hypothetical protein
MKYVTKDIYALIRADIEFSYNGKKMDIEPTDGYTSTMDCILSMQRLVKMLDIDCEKITAVLVINRSTRFSNETTFVTNLKELSGVVDNWLPNDRFISSH